MTDRRLLLVHAHPDDESIETGATMAAYAAADARVTLVTCTLGEEGEICVPALAHLAADRDDRLGEYRAGELVAACAALGVTDHRFLGGAGRWRDSGMMGVASNDRPGCFWRADIDEAADALATIIRQVRPQVVVTYDARGYYGHPDHIQAYRVTVRAIELARSTATVDLAPAGRPWSVRKLYATAMPRTVLAAGQRAVRRSGTAFTLAESVEVFGIGVPDDQVTTRIDGPLPAKTGALRAHATQVVVDPPCYALSDGVAQHLSGVEYFTLLDGDPAPAGGRRETDLFAGVD